MGLFHDPTHKTSTGVAVFSNKYIWDVKQAKPNSNASILL